MKNTLIIAALFAAALAVSCETKEAIPEAPVVRTFTCVFGQPDSKVSIASDGKTQWEVGDQILVHAGTDGNERETVTLTASDISADGKVATITTTLPPYIHYIWGTETRDDVSEYYAMYPADAVAPKTLYYNAPFTQPNGVLMAACNKDDTFVFFNLCGLITFEVSGDFDSYRFSGNNNEVVSYEVYQARVRDEGSGPKATYVKPADSYKPLVELKEASMTLTSGVNYLGIPGGADFTKGFTFKFYKGGTLVKTATTGTAVNVAPGKLLPLGDITSKLETYVAPSVSDHSVAAEYSSATDLSASGSANCYIISAPGYYKLPAVKGNDKTQSVGAVFGAELLWETYNNETSVVANSVIAGVDYDGPSNYLYFKTPDTLKPGNALIAAKDVNDDIIWSWHIWIPETTIGTVSGIHTTDIMDRNLGALIATTAATDGFIDVTSIGMVYQWGRKDPFLGPDKVKAGSYRNWAAYTGTASFSVSAVNMSLEESIQKPTLLAQGTSNNPNWLVPYDAELWGDSGSKAIYDPCPPGYRVPKRDKDYALWSNSSAPLAYNSTNYWFTLGDPATVFPCAGYRNGSDFKIDFRTIIWNAHSDSYQGDKDEPHYAAYNRRVYIESSALKFRNDSSQSKSLGGSVRCCVE